MSLDALDHHLLALLQRGVYTIETLAREVESNSSTVSRRLQRLKDEEYLQIRGVIPDPAKVGLVAADMHIRIPEFSASRFEKAISSDVLVTECVINANGEYCLRLYGNNMAQLGMLSKRLESNFDGTITNFAPIISCIKRETALPVQFR